MNKVLNTIFESGMRILLVLGIILAVQGCSKDSYTQQDLDDFIAANQNEFLGVSEKIIGDNPPSRPHVYILGNIYHMPISDGSRLFFEIDRFDKPSKFYEIDDPKYGKLFFDLASDNKIRSNVLGGTSVFNLISVSNSEIRFSKDKSNYSLKKVTESYKIEALKNAPKVDTHYLETEYRGICLPGN